MWGNGVDPFNLIVCGVGGQGNILISRMLGRILYRKGLKVSIGETFGAAQRGGAVFSSLRISRKRVYGPLIPQGRAHLILSLEPMETLRMLAGYGNEEVTVITNTEPIYPVGALAGRSRYPELGRLLQAIRELSGQCWTVNANELAARLGAPVVANIVLLGCLVGTARLPIEVREVEADIRETLPADKVELNSQALALGFEAIAAHAPTLMKSSRKG